MPLVSWFKYAVDPVHPFDYKIYSWCDCPKEADLCTTMLTVGDAPWLSPNPHSAALGSKELPEGKRIIRDWDFHRYIWQHPADKLQGTAAATAIQGPWAENGAKALRERMKTFLWVFKNEGGLLDHWTIDFEDFPFNGWAVQANAAYGEALVKDPRYVEIKTLCGLSDLSIFVGSNWANHRDEFMAFNAAMQVLSDRYLNYAITEVVREFYPNATVSNYGTFVVSKSNAAYDTFANKPYTLSHFGTVQAPSLYGVYSDWGLGTVIGEASPWGSLLFTVNTLRSMKLSSTLPMLPYVAWKNFWWNGAPDSHLGEFAGTKYYDESILHMCMAGVDNFLFWNPQPGSGGTSNPADELHLNDLVKSCKVIIDRRSVYGNAPLTTDWHTDYIVSAVKNPQGFVYRVTFKHPEIALDLEIDGKMFKGVKPAAGEVGTWLKS